MFSNMNFVQVLKVKWGQNYSVSLMSRSIRTLGIFFHFHYTYFASTIAFSSWDFFKQYSKKRTAFIVEKFGIPTYFNKNKKSPPN